MAPIEMNKVEQTSASIDSTKKKETKATPIGDASSIEEFTKMGLGEIVEATKATNAYPQGASRDLYCAYPTFGRIIDEQSDRILGIISKVLKWQNIKGNIQRRQQDEQFEMVLECNDAILERVNSNLDELAGTRKTPQTIVVESRLNTIATDVGKGAGSWNLKKSDATPMSARLITAKNIARPQLKFPVSVDNSASAPFIPKIKDKPNSLKPLAVLPEYDEAGNVVSYLHPYEFELMKFEVTDAQLGRKSPKVPQELAETELVYVDTVIKLKKALDEIRQYKEIAIDVEHHSYRTFLGFTCLVQISTRSKDYIFDTLELREDMHILNEVFTDPKVVKILHGADLDIEWLQRDLSLYIVNMFDTHQAAKALNFARLSLSYLLKHYCNIEADKTFQLADWRIRPLPPQLVAYARQDTHFLIYVFERITNDLLDAANQKANILRTIYQRSNELCKKRYVKPQIGPDSHMDIYRKSKRIFDNRQLYALREIFNWRDITARQEDESYGYVLPNHMMLQMSESLPREMQGILACCNPIPPLVRQHLHALHQIILRARQQSLVKPILETDVIHRVVIDNVKDYNNKLYCPHDLSHCEEFRDDLPTLLNFNAPEMMEPQTHEEVSVKMCKPKLSVFEKPQQTNECLKQQNSILDKIQFISPYQRYLAMLPLVEKEKKEEAARIEAENKNRMLCPAATMIQPTREEPIVKTEVDEQDELYSVPIKEMLKRKYDECVANKKAANAANPDTPKAKRYKSGQSSSSSTTQTVAATTKAKSITSNNEDSVVEVIDSDSDGPPEEMPSTSEAHPQTSMEHQESSKKKQPKWKNNKRNKNKFKANQHGNRQSSDRPVHENFDYQKVDFKRFKGGAQRAKGTELRPQFHGKNNSNKATNKKFNKLFTFSNVKANKK